jgi:hypothetical protein
MWFLKLVFERVSWQNLHEIIFELMLSYSASEKIDKTCENLGYEF